MPAATLVDEAEAGGPPVELDAAVVRARFDACTAGTVGLEEEVMLLDPHTLAPVPRSAEVVAAAGDDRIKPELPACQVELVSRAHPAAVDAARELAELRTALAAAARATGVVAAAAAVHPWVAETGPSGLERHHAIETAYGQVARRQLVGSLQVHVAPGSAADALALYNALRGYLPELAALAASAPFHEGRDTGLASVRPIVAGQLPRQGVPPVIESWESFVADLAWGRATGSVPEPRWWWWELRPHVHYGTLEVRVPDVQATPAATAAVAAVVHALVRHLAALLEERGALAVPPTWRVAENRWRALRDGVHGELADLVSGDTVPTARRLHALLDDIEPHAVGHLDAARDLVDRNGADDLRAAGCDRAAGALVAAFDSEPGPSTTTPTSPPGATWTS